MISRIIDICLATPIGRICAAVCAFNCVVNITIAFVTLRTRAEVDTFHAALGCFFLLLTLSYAGEFRLRRRIR